jgi:hypothetical protein
MFINIAQIPIYYISLQWLLGTYDFSSTSGGRDSITDKQALYSNIFSPTLLPEKKTAHHPLYPLNWL